MRLRKWQVLVYISLNYCKCSLLQFFLSVGLTIFFCRILQTLRFARPRTNVKGSPKLWGCRKCTLEFSTRKLLRDHRKTAHVEYQEPITYKYDNQVEGYVCNICSAEFQNENEANEHMVTHIKVFQCSICNEGFKNAYHYSCHLQQHDGLNFRCPLCPSESQRRNSMRTHINRIHYNKFHYYCDTCGKGFNDAVFFAEHSNEHQGLKPFKCVVCEKTFAFSRYLNNHQTRYHRVDIQGQLMKNQCPLCSRVFARDGTLESHLLSRHSKKKPQKGHLCDICGKGFAVKNKLRIHYRVHTGVKPYTCHYCSKAFTKREYLVMHERVHTGEKPYECEYCGKCFNQGASLRIHIRGHTGERPYICQGCNGGFISKGALQTHYIACKGGRGSKTNCKL